MATDTPEPSSASFETGLPLPEDTAARKAVSVAPAGAAAVRPDTHEAMRVDMHKGGVTESASASSTKVAWALTQAEGLSIVHEDRMGFTGVTGHANPNGRCDEHHIPGACSRPRPVLFAGEQVT